MHNITLETLPTSLKKAIENFYRLANFEVSEKIVKEPESTEYDAYRLKINGKNILFRNAKITPTKIGQFVTLWKRSSKTGEIEPIGLEDNIDIVVIAINAPEGSGQFIFNSNLAIKKRIFSYENKEGKRAIRVYPPWCKVTSQQALSTQKWQVEHFLSYSDTNSQLINNLQKLFR